MQQFAEPLYAWVRDNRQSVIINGLADSLRSQLCRDIPYKVMAFPVTGSQGTIIGMLVCVNHLHSTDYFNSDRNLLEIISRKITKILQVKYDSLTGLMKLRAFQPVLEKAIASANAHGITHSFLNVDLDQLKVINDSMGREAGDAAIRYIAYLLREKLRVTDTVSYHGEGCFGVLLEKCQVDQGLCVADNLRKAIAETGFTRDSKAVDVSVSIGMALIEPHAKNADAILEAAEIARDSAKESGRNSIQVYRHDDSDLTARKEQMQWVSRIQEALREDQFQIYAQTIEPLADANENYHFEILLRLTDREGDVVLPGAFLPPAERFNLMPTIDRWVIDKTFATLSEHGFAQSSLEGIVSINLAGQSLSDEGLIDYIDQKFTEYGLSMDCICFEVTETSAIGNMESAHYIMSSLKEKGCRFSLDDFGTGLSSFSYLKYLPVEYVKIDGSFVREMLDDQVAHAMVSSINQIGHVMGLKTIAEFVENDELRKQLELISIDYIQGFSVCKPVPLEDYLAVLLRGDTVMTG
jgi:diguanylate cyclase (GGDEF)-like protein